MKIVSILLTNITKTAGTERAVANLSNILVSLGYSICIFSTDSKAGAPAYHLDEKVKIFHLGLQIASARNFSKIFEYKKLKQKIKILVREERIDCIIGTYSLFNALITKIKNVKTIGCEHFNYSSASKFHRIVRRIFYPKLDAVVVLTNHDKSHYQFLKNCVVIPNSLSFETEIKTSWNEKKVLSIGRLTKQKGFDFLIEAAKELKNDFPDWHFEIVGTGEDEKLLKGLVLKYELEDYVLFLTPIKDVISLYKSASIYCMSSRWEGFPMVLLEARACGLACVSFDCPEGPSEQITDNTDGFLCEAENSHDLAEKLRILMSNEKLREKFGKNAFESSKRFSSKNIGKKWKQLLESIK